MRALAEVRRGREGCDHIRIKHLLETFAAEVERDVCIDPRGVAQQLVALRGDRDEVRALQIPFLEPSKETLGSFARSIDAEPAVAFLVFEG
jgi:hypothetical protein